MPVDAIAGTSMGAVVGGLYASGLSAADIERVMTSVDWQDAFRDRPARKDLNFRRKLEDQNFLVKFPLGLKGREVPPAPRPGAGTEDDADPARPDAAGGAAAELRRPRHPVPRHRHRHRDRRPRRPRPRRPNYRDARQPVGARACSRRWRVDGRMLVDGGLSSNLPIDVAREMGVDVLIVVDCGFPLLERGKLDSVATVTQQMLAILVRHNATEQRKTLTDRDVIIDPALGDFSSLDFTEHEKAMKIGEQAARGVSERLAALSVPAAGIPAHRGGARARSAATRPRSTSCASSPAPSATPAPSTRCSATRWARPSTPRRSTSASTSCTARATSRSSTTAWYRTTAAPGQPPGYGLALTTRRNSWGPNYLSSACSCRTISRATPRSMPRCAAPWPRSPSTAASGSGTCRSARTRAPPPRSICRWVTARAGSPRRTCEFQHPHAAGDRRATTTSLAEYRVRSTDYGLDLGRELGNYGEVRVGWGRRLRRVAACGSATPILRAQEFDSRTYLRRVPLRHRRRRELPAPRRHVLAGLARRARGQGPAG